MMIIHCSFCGRRFECLTKEDTDAHFEHWDACRDEWNARATLAMLSRFAKWMYMEALVQERLPLLAPLTHALRSMAVVEAIERGWFHLSWSHDECCSDVLCERC